MHDVERIVEALLFATSEPISLQKIQEIIETVQPIKPKELRELLEKRLRVTATAGDVRQSAA